MRYVLVCDNEACKEALGGRVFSASYVLKYDRAAGRMKPEFKGTPVKCPECGSVLVFREQQTDIPTFSVSGFKGLPDEEKKRVLRQRFDADNKRVGSDIKEANKRKAMEKLTGYDKQ